MIFAVVDFEWVTAWLTPVWLLSMGVMIGLIAMICAAGIAIGIGAALGKAKTVQREILVGLREGVLFPITIIAVLLSLFACSGPAFVRRPAKKLESIARLPYARLHTREYTVPPAERDQDNEIVEGKEAELAISFNTEELRRMSFLSDRRVTLSAKPEADKERILFDILPDEKVNFFAVNQVVSPFPEEGVTKLYALNYSTQPAKLTIEYDIQPPDPEVALIIWTALGMCIFYLAYFVQRTLAPRLSAIALATFKSEVNSPLFLLLSAVGSVLLTIFIWIPYNTFGEDIKMLKDSGLTLILVLTIFQAVWAASMSVSDEIEGRTALTVLSKPINRRAFLIGKFMGILWTVALMFVILSVVFLIAVAFKPVYDSRENSEEMPTWQACHLEMVRTVPGIALMFMQTMVLAALSVALSTRVALVPNLVICFAVYVIGHLTPLLVQSSEQQFEVVKFFAHLLATGAPVLENFNIAPAIAANVPVPYEYLGLSLVYCFLYTVIALLLALLFFEDRDLA